MADTKKAAQEFLTYKGKPLVRCGDEIYYGSMEDPYVIRMQIKSKKNVNGVKQLVKSSEKNGLYLAMDIADIWLERALANKV